MRHTWDRGGEARHDVCLVCRAMSQTDGATPLCIASQNGHVECVRALLAGGAAIDQARVSSGRSMARRGGGYSRGAPWEPCRMHVHWGLGNTVILAFDTRVTLVVRAGMTAWRVLL